VSCTLYDAASTVDAHEKPKINLDQVEEGVMVTWGAGLAVDRHFYRILLLKTSYGIRLEEAKAVPHMRILLYSMVICPNPRMEGGKGLEIFLCEFGVSRYYNELCLRSI
jgi:hypothetical protein